MIIIWENINELKININMQHLTRNIILEAMRNSKKYDETLKCNSSPACRSLKIPSQKC